MGLRNGSRAGQVPAVRLNPGADAVPVVAVDGPAASGKGTVAAGVAAALGFRLLDSGALYRLVALKAIRSGAASSAGAELAVLTGGLDVAFVAGRVLLDGDDVTEAIRAEAISAAASAVAVHPQVRAALLQRQRAFRQSPGLVADGRDMGTVVFPDAAVKVFVTASLEERANRRHNQLIEKGNSSNIDDLLRELRDRDARDAARTASPLRKADDAVVLETTNLSIADATAFVLRLCAARGLAARTP
jgi:cytidylate kinase